jgi:D-alanine-D-alanine ligase
MAKIKVGVFFGGRSSEHEISLRSAKSVMQNLDQSKYSILPIGIDRNGKFFFGKASIFLNMPHAAEIIEEIQPEGVNTGTCLPDVLDQNLLKLIDVAFPAIHGPFCEDGALQGMLRSFGVPFVGACVLGSAICMDKDVAKRLLKEAGIPCAKGITVRRSRINEVKYEDVKQQLGDIIFVKPANLGSSVGVQKTKNEKDFSEALQNAFMFDNKVLLEECISGREIECSVLGNENPEAALPGEIILKSDFYSYEAKYISENSAELKIPADLPPNISDTIKEMAVKTFQTLCCEGMARVDFFLRNNSEIFVNEVNTLPGFTNISMYPKLWAHSGVSYSDLLDRLITLALERHQRDSKLCITP